MPTRVVMPKLGLSMKAGTISAWRAQDGQAVQTGQTLFVVETDKINMEIEAAADGTLKHAEPEGVTVPVGHLIGFILAAGEVVPADAGDSATGAAASGVAATQAAPATPVAMPAQQSGGRVLSSPVARKLAQQLGIDLATVTGSGPGGRVVKEDVEAAAARGPEVATMPTPGAPAASSSPATVAASDQRRPMSQMRQTISDRMSASLRDSAQLTIGTEVDVTDLTGLIGSMSGDTSSSSTITDYLVLAVARALREHPILNSSLEGDEIVLHGAVHLGLAVALSDGLVVPVLRDVQSMTVRDIALRRRDLADAARGGRLGLDDLTGSTFTISSLGQSRVTWFTPIINPPEAAILGVGRATDKVRWVDGAAAPRRVLPLSLTIDHRLIDGAPGAAFLDDLALSLSEPLRLLA